MPKKSEAAPQLQNVGAAVSKVAKSHAGAKVIVASKLPNALELYLEMKTVQERRYQGAVWTEDVFVPVPDGERVVVAGTNYPIGAPPPGIIWPDKPRMVAGAALTFGVDKDFWDTWLEQRKGTQMVRNNLIAAFDNEADARAWAREHVKQDSGLGPMIPDTDRRWPRKVTAIEARKLTEETAEVE